MATAIEGALTGLLGPVIDFLADYLGFGDLPGEIANLIRGLQQQVMDALESVVGFVVEGARGLLGMGGGQGPAAGAGGGDGEIGETVAFSDVDEEHRLWVQTEGAQATLMVASETPAPVQEKLSTWSRSDQLGKVPDQTDDGGRPRDEARSLIDAARALLGQGDQQADALARALQQAHTLSTGSAPPDTERLDNSLEATEHALSTILARLFTIFKQKPNLQVIYAHQVERADPNARADISRYLSPGSERARPDGIEQRWELAKQWLEQQPAVRDMLSGPLNSSHEFGTAAVSGQAIPALRDALAANGLDSSFCGTGADSVSAYVENRKGIIHQALPPFARSRAELGEQVFDADHRPQADATLTREFTARVRDDKFSHLNRPDIARALEDVSKGEGWVAAFATGGIMLRSAPGADAPPLTLGDVWRSMERSTADVIATVSDAVQRTIAADPSFTGLLGGRTAEDAAVDIARQIVSNMGNATLYIVRHTEIPRYVEPGAHVLINADGESRNSALYASIAARSRDAALSQLAGEIHHVVPLYAGGGHVETNLMRAEGDARIAADAAETAHHVMHQFIDDLEITRYMDNLKVRLREPDLRREFPDDVIKIMIGVLYSDGHIDYSETDLMYKVSLDSKGLP
jgi:hypothetical protein